MFVPEEEMTSELLRRVIERACANFDDPLEAMKVREMKGLDEKKTLFISELWHGATMSFKDLGLRFEESTHTLGQ